MEENFMNANARETEKIKTHYARIVVDGTAEKPCYSIEWFNPIKKEYCLGYSSYDIRNVFNWLYECFEIVETTKSKADRVRTMTDEELAELLDAFSACNRCRRRGNDCFPVPNTLEWLKRPAEEE